MEVIVVHIKVDSDLVIDLIGMNEQGENLNFYGMEDEDEEIMIDFHFDINDEYDQNNVECVYWTGIDWSNQGMNTTTNEDGD